MKVTIEQEFWDLFPQAQVVVMTVEGIDNHVDESKDPYFKDLLDKGVARSKVFIDDEQFRKQQLQDTRCQARRYAPFQCRQHGNRCSLYVY